ncbi:MAG: iron ABC transporter permease [Nitrospira sp.]|nr:iron ABC transporter permease [Nitrospira sp.]
MSALTAVRHTAGSPLSVLALTVAALLLAPLLYVVTLALSVDPAVWQRLWATRIPELLTNTAWLAAGTALGTCLLGLSLAWIVVRYEFPGRQIWEWALVLPLAMPTYVLAYVYAHLASLGGPLDDLWQHFAGPQSHLPSPQSLGGTTLVMTLATFPFVYLLTRVALLNYNVSFDEVARSCNASRLRRLFGVTLPLLRPAIVAGLSLVILYVVSDFGAVSLLRFQTLTYAVYQQMTGRYDTTAAGALSLLLVIFALLFFAAERWFRQRSRFYQSSGRFRTWDRCRCGTGGTTLILLYLGLVLGAAFLVPAGLLVEWSLSAIAQHAVDQRFWGFAGNSMMLSGLAATVAVLLGTPLASLASRKPSRVNLFCLQAAYAGYVVPGPVGALALLVLCLHFAPWWYGTAVVVVLAYVIHFLPAGLQSLEPAFQQINPNIEEAARSLGLNAWQALRRVTLPLIKNGFLAAWVLMFLQSMKELPATLLLRPVGFDTLAVRVWLEASEEYYQLAAPAALLIVLLALPALWLLVARDWRASMRT